MATTTRIRGRARRDKIAIPQQLLYLVKRRFTPNLDTGAGAVIRIVAKANGSKPVVGAKRDFIIRPGNALQSKNIRCESCPGLQFGDRQANITYGCHERVVSGIHLVGLRSPRPGSGVPIAEENLDHLTPEREQLIEPLRIVVPQRS